MRFARQYHFDKRETDLELDENGWSKPDYFDNSADLYVEVQDLWKCTYFYMVLQDWCDNAKVGDVYEDEDIRVSVCE